MRKVLCYCLFVFLYVEASRNTPSNHIIYKLDEEWHKNSDTKPLNLPQKFYNTYERIKNRTFANTEANVFRFHFNQNKTNILVFNVNKIQNFEELLDAELHIYVNKPNNVYVGLDSVILRLYQILPQNISNPDLHKLLHVVYLRSTFSGWQVFKVTNTLKNWQGAEPNMGFLLTATDVKDNFLEPKFIHFDSQLSAKRLFLVEYLKNANVNTKASNKHKNININSNRIAPSDGCVLKKLYLNISNFQFFNFIIEPKGYEANSCEGSCSVASNELLSNYGRMIHYFKRPKTCCVPVEFDSLPLMFYDQNGDVVIKIYNDMVVTECGCR